MKNELEIEYKNLLTENEYQKILENEFLNVNTRTNYDKIIQVNHYFDTKNHSLKKQGSALRIRRSNDQNELTFKVPKDDFLMETNFSLGKQKTEAILDKKKFSLNTITNEKVTLNLDNINKETIFEHFNSFKNLRYEKKASKNLLVLDQTTFQNGRINYELEVEGENPIDAKDYFDSILAKYSIPFRESSPKIARAEINK